MKPLSFLAVLLFSCLAKLGFAQTRETQTFIESYATEHKFNGSILIQKNGKIGYEQSFGLANFQHKVRNTSETKYRIASITKAFTSVLILQLRERGKIDLNKTIRTYLPSYSGEAADKVTVHQLLNHTSGIDNSDKVKSAEDAIKNGVPNYQAPFTTDQILQKFCSGPLTNTPGKVFSYNNADYIILGKMIERISGKTFDQMLNENILRPLKMSTSGMLNQHLIVDGLASTYFMRDDLKALVNDLPVYPENWFAAGAMYSTPRNVLTFANALFADKLIRKESLALMLTPRLDDYGYGVWSYETKIGDKKYRTVKRPGQIMGAQTQLYHIMDPDITVIILSNTGTTDLDEFVAEIGKRLLTE